MRDIRPKSSAQPSPESPEGVPFDNVIPPAPKGATRSGATVPVHAMRVSSSPTHQPTGSAPAPPAAVRRRMRIGQRERLMISGLLGLMVIAGLLATLLFLPKADIRLVLRTAPLLVDEKLVLSAQAGAAGTVIAGSAFSRDVEVEGTAPVTTTQVVGEKATGTVVIVNRSVEEQKIKEQSRLVTDDGALFYMQTSVTVPPATTVPARAPVTVAAAEAGEAGNIQPQELNFAALDASSQSLVYAEATAPLTGGSGETVSVIGETDIEAARGVAKQTARAQVEQQVRDELPRGWAILEESWTVELPSFEARGEVGEQVTSLPYTAHALVRVMGYEQAALEAHLRQALEQRLEADYMLFPGAITYSKQVESVNWDEGRADIAVRVTHTTVPRFSLDTLRSKIAGYPEAEATQYLEGLPGVRGVSLNLSPFWASTVPRLERRIFIDPQPERQP